MHHVLPTVTMDDPAVFTNFARNTISVTTHKKVDAITNFVEPFGDFLMVNNVDIDNFIKDTHSGIIHIMGIFDKIINIYIIHH